MEQAKSKKKVIIVSAIVLVVLIAAFALIYALVINKPVEGQKALTVEIVFSETDSKTVEITTDAEYLRQALEEQNLISGTESETGLFVTTVDGVTADDSKQEWWCFTKGGETLMTGVDSTPIADGDTFEITLTTGW